jgi:hypothetical protein
MAEAINLRHRPKLDQIIRHRRCIAEAQCFSGTRASGLGYPLYGLLLVGGYFPAVESLDEEIEEIASQLLIATSNPKQLQSGSFDLTKALVMLSQSCVPARETIYTILR